MELTSAVYAFGLVKLADRADWKTAGFDGAVCRADWKAAGFDRSVFSGLGVDSAAGDADHELGLGILHHHF